MCITALFIIAPKLEATLMPYTLMCILLLVLTTNNLKQPRHSLTVEFMAYPCNEVLFSNKKKKLLMHSMTWRNCVSQ